MDSSSPVPGTLFLFLALKVARGIPEPGRWSVLFCHAKQLEQKGLADVPIINSKGKMEVMKVEMQVESVRGFSGHSDRKQLMNYLRRIKPKPERIIILHGEKSKSLNMANLFKRKYNVESLVPKVLETIKLR
jgi:predicted metal-dependent RNase